MTDVVSCILDIPAALKALSGSYISHFASLLLPLSLLHPLVFPEMLFSHAFWAIPFAAQTLALSIGGNSFTVKRASDGLQDIVSDVLYLAGASSVFDQLILGL